VETEGKSTLRRAGLTERLISEVVTPWPPSCWTGSFSGEDILSPDVASSVVAEVVMRREAIRMSVKDNDRLFTTVIHLDDTVRTLVFEVLARMKGRTLAEASEETVESR
jgi:hypothetical protein